MNLLSIDNKVIYDSLIKTLPKIETKNKIFVFVSGGGRIAISY